MPLELAAVDAALTLGFFGNSIRLGASFANIRPWTQAPNTQCGPEELFKTPILLICERDDSVILGTLASLLSLVVVGHGHMSAWNPPRTADLVFNDESGDFRAEPNYDTLKTCFEACTPTGQNRLQFKVGDQLPETTNVSFAGGTDVRARKYEEEWQGRPPYPRPDDCARIWRRLVHLAPGAAPSVGEPRPKLTAVTLESLLAQSPDLVARRIRISSNNSWTRLLGPGVPAVLVPGNSLYLGRWRPWDPYPAPRRGWMLWLQATGLAALQRVVRPSPYQDAAMIGDCWMSVARHMGGWTPENSSTRGMIQKKEVWCIKKAKDMDRTKAQDWPTWRPTPGECTAEYIAPGPWLVE